MAIFKLINEKLDTPTLKIEAKNIEASWDHWKSFKKICEYGKQLESEFYNTKSTAKFFEDKIPIWVINILKDNKRIVDAIFYNTDKFAHSNLLITTDIPKFRDIELLTREIFFKFGDKSRYFSVSVIEITNEEIKDKELNLPEDWYKNEELTTKLNNLKYFI